MAKDLTRQIESSTEFFDVICSSKDCAPELKLKLLREKRATTVFYPSTKQQVRKILMNYSCVIRGGATSYLGQIIPDRNEVIIDMSRFNKVQIFNDIAVVDAGTPFISVLRRAAAEDKEVKVFPLSYRSATPAGFLSNGGKVGIGSPENGSFSDTIEEIEVVTPNSEILVLKDNDIKDFENSEGTLGVMTQLKLRLQNKRVKHMHMYGFDERIDMDRFFSESEDIRFAYFFNRTVGKILNKKWKLKDVPNYSMIVQDYNDKDDYKREFREDLSMKGISFIFPKWIVDYESQRMNMIDFLIKEDRNNIFLADSIGSLDRAIQALKYAEKYNIPVFGMLGKNEILLRFYANCKDFTDREKFLMIMDKVYRHTMPATRGRFFNRYFTGSNEWKRLISSKSKYNISKNLSEREQLNNYILFKKAISPILVAIGGKLW